MLQEKDEAEEKAQEELKKQAKAELEDWYKQHSEQVSWWLVITAKYNFSFCKSTSLFLFFTSKSWENYKQQIGQHQSLMNKNWKQQQKR